MASGEVQASVEDTADAIAAMEIRGASSIAKSAATALREQAVQGDATDSAQLQAQLRAAGRRLYETRPTAVTLANALRYVLARAAGEDVEAVRESVVAAVDEFCTRLGRAQDDLGAVGAGRLADGDTVMTHCHSTDVLACLETAVDRGLTFSAVVKETRPRRQGELTAKRLQELGVPVTFVVDSAAHRYLRDADHVFVGADTVTADGSVVNKIGTRPLAVTARERDTPIVVAAQTLKLDPETLTGKRIDIEHRSTEEVLDDPRVDLSGVEVANPAFDRTPPRYVDVVVTEQGQFPPESIAGLMRELYGREPDRPWEEPT